MDNSTYRLEDERKRGKRKLDNFKFHYHLFVCFVSVFIIKWICLKFEWRNLQI